MKGYKEIPADRMPGNVIEMIGRQWMLVTAGSGEQCNTMTASWGGIGVIWGQPAATVYIRPQRYTREFVDAEPRLTLSFMGRSTAGRWLTAAHSGRTEEKIARAGLTVEHTPAGTPCIGGAEIVLECRKMYRDRFDPRNFWRRS
ncbi:MAG: flavin reductase [Alistipes inops]